MEILEEKIKNKTQFILWGFYTKEIDDNYVLFNSSASIGDLTVFHERYVNKEDQTDLIASLIVERIKKKLVVAIFEE